MGKRELIALLNLSSWCLVMVERLFLAVPRGCLQFVIVVFPDHTHLLFLCVSTPVKMPHCWKSHVTAQIWFLTIFQSSKYKNETTRNNILTWCLCNLHKSYNITFYIRLTIVL